MAINQIAVLRNPALAALPLYLLLGCLALQHQLLISQLQVPCREVQLLINLSVLLIHLAQHLQLLCQVLQKIQESVKCEEIQELCLCTKPIPEPPPFSLCHKGT